jgi:manganese efflux pump family protein
VGFAALITWFAAVLAGLYMLTVWLIENDVTGRHAAPSQLRVPVIFGHLALAIAGLVVWVAYLVLDREVLAWAAAGTLPPWRCSVSRCSPGGYRCTGSRRCRWHLP